MTLCLEEKRAESAYSLMDPFLIPSIMQELKEREAPLLSVNRDNAFTQKVCEKISVAYQRIFYGSNEAFFPEKFSFLGNCTPQKDGSVRIPKSGIVYGPYFSFFPGSYRVDFYFRAGTAPDCTFDVYVDGKDGGVLACAHGTPDTHLVSLPFSFSKPMKMVEFRVHNFSEQPLFLERILVTEHISQKNALPTRKVLFPERFFIKRKGSPLILSVLSCEQRANTDALLLIFEKYSSFFRPDAKLLILRESTESSRSMFCTKFGKNVFFLKNVPKSKVPLYYRQASLFLCMEGSANAQSLLDAMRFGLPVIAEDTPSVAETMGDSGVLISPPNHALTAIMIDCLLSDSTLREAVLRAQKKNLLRFDKVSSIPKCGQERDHSYTPTVSVIINTYNRGQHLQRLLHTLSKQTYENFEIVVVNGPSTDGTDEVLQKYRKALRIETCEVRNLCVSRNIGIRAAAGDILAFIDDDAIPESQDWILNAVSAFQNEKVAMVAGTVKRINGTLEFHYGYFSVFGENQSVSLAQKNFSKKEKVYYTRSAGGNAFFRKSALCEIGGYDEYFQYYLEDSDICLRLHLAGYTLAYHDDITIIHEAAPGINRISPYHQNWEVIVRSNAYFIIKATERLRMPKKERERKVRLFTSQAWLHWFSSWRAAGEISNEDSQSFIEAAKKGMEQGIQDGFSKERKLDFSLQQASRPFQKMDKSVFSSLLSLCFFREQDPALSVPDLFLQSLVKCGHDIHIIQRGEASAMSMENGTTVHSVCPEALSLASTKSYTKGKQIIDFSYACHKRLKILQKVFSVELMESPLHPPLGLVSSYFERGIPLVLSLPSPPKQTDPSEDSTEDLAFLSACESALFARADAFIAETQEEKHEAEQDYGVSIRQPFFERSEHSESVYKKMIQTRQNHTMRT